MKNRKRSVKKTVTKTVLYILHILLLIIIFLPLVFALTSSFRPLSDLYRYVSPLTWKTFIPTNITLDAYITIFTEGGYGTALLNSLLIAFVTVILGILFNSMAGYVFAKYSFRGKKLLFSLVMLSYMVPFELLSVNLYDLIIKLEWVDTYKALIIPCIANGMIIFLFQQYYFSFPDYLLEAAQIDGMGHIATYFRIVLPNSKAVCISAGLVLFINQWESFLWPVLVTRSKELYTVQLALSNFSTQYTKNWDQIFAGSIIAFLLPVMIIMPLQKFFAAGLTSSGVKE